MEILVHISAPSKASDDATYRALGSAYQSFQSPDDEGSRSPIRVSLHGEHSGKQDVLDVRDDDLQNSLSRQAPYVLSESQDLSFRSAIDNLSSPRCRSNKSSLKQGTKDQENQPSQSHEAPVSQDTLPSQICDSYPMPSQSLLYNSPTRMFQQFMTSSGLSSKICTSSPPSRKRKRHQTLAEEESHPGGQAPTAEINSSIPKPSPDTGSGQVSKEKKSFSNSSEHNIIPVTPFSKENPTSKTHAKEANPLSSEGFDALHPDITHISNSTTSQPPLPDPDPEPEPESNAFAKPDSQPASGRPQSRQLLLSSSPGGKLPHSSLLPTPTPLPPRLLNTLEIYPPSPSPSTSSLTSSSLIPPKLAKLAVDLSSRYRPVTNRPIHDLERGYWLVDCTSWSPESKADAWAFLTQYVGSGLAGWGVWCTRGHQREWIRVFCWGCVVKHIYLLVYLASGRRLKSTGARWMDASGEEVVKVPAA